VRGGRNGPCFTRKNIEGLVQGMSPIIHQLELRVGGIPWGAKESPPTKGRKITDKGRLPRVRGEGKIWVEEGGGGAYGTHKKEEG